ncbi:WhiB family transcriptional regulator [Streptomyces hydrogenans]|uniref:WhiB family transcriptional regulator n=1 Tax=Streptomyces hydrogenans TaxID=1873719 RepID=UPI003695B4A2
MTTLYTRTAPDTLDAPLAWLDHGLCRFRPDVFTSLATAPEAKRICVRCPVLGECRAWIRRVESGNSASQRENVVGGLTPDERTALDPVLIERAKERAVRAAAAQPTTKKKTTVARVKEPVERSACGTYAGSRLHERRGEIDCVPCLDAAARQRAGERLAKRLPQIRNLWALGKTDAEIAAAAKCRRATVRAVREYGGLQENLPPQTAAA